MEKCCLNGYGILFDEELEKRIDIEKFKKFFDVDIEGKTFSELYENGFILSEFIVDKETQLDEKEGIYTDETPDGVYIYIPLCLPWEEKKDFKNETETALYIYKAIKPFLKDNVEKEEILNMIGIITTYWYS